MQAWPVPRWCTAGCASGCWGVATSMAPTRAILTIAMTELTFSQALTKTGVEPCGSRHSSRIAESSSSQRAALYLTARRMRGFTGEIGCDFPR